MIPCNSTSVEGLQCLLGVVTLSEPQLHAEALQYMLTSLHHATWCEVYWFIRCLWVWPSRCSEWSKQNKDMKPGWMMKEPLHEAKHPPMPTKFFFLKPTSSFFIHFFTAMGWHSMMAASLLLLFLTSSLEHNKWPPEALGALTESFLFGATKKKNWRWVWGHIVISDWTK